MEQLITLKKNKSLKESIGGITPCLFLCLLATVIIFAVFFGSLYFFKVYPFSDKTVSQYDLVAQIVPFAEHFFDVINGDASFFYSYRLGGGMDIFGTVMYCLFSPFTFLFFLFGEGNVYYAASIMLPVKLACIAIAAIVMMKTCFKSMHNALVLPVALLYAFCGYMFTANTYINWLDFLVYLPFGVMAFNYMRKTGKIRYLALVIAACIYTCFSIACFSMLISYPIFVLYGFLVVEKAERKEYLFKISLCYLCGVLAALPIMVPSLLAYLKSGRNTGIFDSLWDDIWPTTYYRKYSYILSDAFFVLLIVVYFIKTRFQTKESRFLALAGLLIMMPVLVDECCILLNMGSYMSYALRFGFLNAIYELVVACLVLKDVSFKRSAIFNANEDIRQEEQKQAIVSSVSEQTPKETVTTLRGAQPKKTNDSTVLKVILTVFLAILALAACALIFFVFCAVCSTDLLDFSFSSDLQSWWDGVRESSKDFSGSFAHSTGGLQGILIIFAAVAIVTVPAILLYKFRLLRLRSIYPCVAAVLFIQICFYGTQLVSGNIFNPTRYNVYNALYEKVLKKEELPDYAYRIKDASDGLSANQGFITNINAYTVFSSVTDETNFAANTVFGFGGNGINTLKSYRGNLLGDCLIGNKYFLYHSEKNSTLNRDYLTEVAREKDFILYENALTFPSAYTVSSKDMGVTTDYDYYFENMQNLYTFLGGEGDVFATYEIAERDIAYQTATDKETGETREVIFVKVRLHESGDISFYSDFPAEMQVKYFTETGDLQNAKDISSVKTYTYSNKRTGSYYYMYLYADNPDYKLTKEDVLNYCSVKIIPRETVEKLSQVLRERAVEYDLTNTLTATSYTARVTTDKEGEYLFINYVNIDGMRAYVNGKEVDLVENGLKMILVPLEKGANEVKIVYTSPYPFYSLAAALVAIAVLTAIAFVTNKKKTWVKALQTPVAVASVTISVAVVAIFMVFPTIVFILKLILLKF